jgi:hypothetical protein
MADQKRRTGFQIDFSREADRVPDAAVEVPPRDLQRDPSGPLAGARRAPELSEDAPLAAARSRQEQKQKQYRAAEDSDAARVALDDEPEFP